jgi:hypothetical protein
MEEKTSDSREKETSIIKVEEMNLEETQLAEQLYSSAGLDPVVDAGLKDYDKRLQKEDKLISKVLGPRGSDIRGYGEAVAKRVTLAIYTLLNKQYGGKVGDLRSYIMTLEEERDGANARYDELMGRVVGILADEYKELRTDSKAFMERLTGILGEDLKTSRINHEALAARLADIDGLRSQIKTLDKEKEQLKETYESQIAALRNEHNEELGNLASEKATVTTELAHLRADHDQLKTAITTLAGAIPDEKMEGRLGEELYGFILKDSQVPDIVIAGVAKFIDFKKYLRVAVERGTKEVRNRIEEILATTR